MFETDIKELVIRMKASDKEAFKAVFYLYQQCIFNFLFFKLNNAAVAEDLLQDVFLKLWQNRFGLDEHKSLQSYLYTIAANLTLNFYRSQNVRNNYLQLQPKEPVEILTPFSLLESKELNSTITEAIKLLPDKIRIVFLMHRVENKSYKEIALCLNINVKTVESHISKALHLIRRQLREIIEKNNESIRVKHK
jgi:RNA polymerase sigma-70 factor (ECF subfamily)